ncbi:MAG: XRE family transcriptional regulator [Proteobacteria bacterium]|nr:XRE family transcriptional regulator [Pseudomonadota bacterium]
MAISVEDYIKTLPLERQEAIERRAQELISEEKTLQELRKAAACSQVQLAQKLGVKQAAISKMERRTDMYVSTLRSFVEGMGGSLDIIATFPRKAPVKITQFQDLDALKSV